MTELESKSVVIENFKELAIRELFDSIKDKKYKLITQNTILTESGMEFFFYKGNGYISLKIVEDSDALRKIESDEKIRKAKEELERLIKNNK